MGWDHCQYGDLLLVRPEFCDGNCGKLLVNFLGYNKLRGCVESSSI